MQTHRFIPLTAAGALPPRCRAAACCPFYLYRLPDAPLRLLYPLCSFFAGSCRTALPRWFWRLLRVL